MYNPYEIEAERKIAMERYEPLKHRQVSRGNARISIRNGIGRIGGWLVAVGCAIQLRFLPEKVERACVS